MSLSIYRPFSTTSGHTCRRVVVTGMGLVSSLGVGVDYVWQRLLKGESGIGKAKFGDDSIPSQVCGYVPRGDNPGQLNVDKMISRTDQNHMNDTIAFAMVAAEEALTQAKWKPEDVNSKERTGVSIGAGMSEPDIIIRCSEDFKSGGYRKISPYIVPRLLTNMPAGWVSIKYGFQGPNHSVATACATGIHSIGDAYRMIQMDDADIMVAGGSEAVVGVYAMAGFCRAKALSTKFNNEPEKASRPFDKNRDGFVMAEGAGVVVLEELEHAKQRGANILGEILGFGMSGDAFHLTAPRKDGKGAELSMKRALRNINVRDIGYVNAHATSTPLGDEAETCAIGTVFAEHAKNIGVSSTKGSFGHLLAGAGSTEAIVTLMACNEGVMPPTINLTDPDPVCGDLNFIPNTPQSWPDSFTKRIALTNSFGFGGTNASLCVGQYIE